MDVANFAYAHHFTKAAPAPAARFTGLPMYNFIGGHNDPMEIPTEALATAAAAVIRREGASLALYGLGTGPQGYPALRDFVADKLRRHRGMTADRDAVLITTGSGQSIDILSSLFVAPGETVLLEEFCYQGAINRFRKMGATVLPMAIDDDGIRIDALATQLAALKAAGTVPKMIYTIPTIQNPTGSILPLDRRHGLLALAKQYGIVIFEDECYADLIWAGGAPPSLYALDPSQVVHIGSFSKSLAPALRVGYAVADWAVLSRMIAMKTDGGTGALDQMIIAEYFSQHFDAHAAHLSAVLQDKLNTMIEACEREFGTSLQLYKPQGGIFMWMKLPDSVDVRTLIAPSAKANLVFNPGPDWAVDGEAAKSYFRLCFGLASKQEIIDGVALLAKICHAETGVPVHSANVKNSAS
jgi:2-aminoadipate transaminase